MKKISRIFQPYHPTACASIKLMLLCLGILLFSCTSICLAQETRFPAPRGYVNDYANILGSQSAQIIDTVFRQIETKTTAQIALVIVDSTKPLAIEQYAVELFQAWGIGQSETDNGLLLLVAIKDKTIRIETGYGLEGAIPDALASSIIHQVILPEFRKGDYETGLLRGSLGIADLVAQEYNVSLDLDKEIAGAMPSQENKASPLAIIFYILFFILIFGMRSGLLFYFILGGSGRRRGGYWYGSGLGGSSRGGFGGGFGGFGGGFSGGGGASGGW
jgi:uncharacterized protein